MFPPPPPPDYKSLAWGPYISVALIALANFLCYSFNDNSLIGRLLWKRHGRSTFFASNKRWVSRSESLPGRPEQFWAFDVLEPDHLVTSHFLGDWSLLTWHTITLLWLPVCLLVEQYCNDPLASEWVTWFTHWSLVLLSAAGGLGVALQARYMLRRRKAGECITQISPEASLEAAEAGAWCGDAAPSTCGCVDTKVHEKAEGGGAPLAACPAPSSRQLALHRQRRQKSIQWDWLSIAYVLAMQTAITAALFLDVYYWVVLIAVQGDAVGAPATYLKHGGNLGIAFVTVVITRLPVVSVHLQAVLAYGTCYMLFLWVYGNATDTWRYGLAWDKLSSVVMHGAVPVALAVALALWWALAAGRERVGRAWAARSKDFK